jgi:hypothetical protein
MSIVLPGFPAAGNRIESPDVAELLLYPNFIVAEADTVWKFGSDFQRELLSKCNLKHNRKHVTVYSGVHVVSKQMRPITTVGLNAERGREWHIDGLDNQSYDHFYPEETVHLYLSHASLPTEFQKYPLEITDPKLLAMNRYDFCYWLNTDEGIAHIDAAPIENERIYEFSNHIHRALVPDRPQFRYTFRVRETDRADIPSVKFQVNKQNRYWDAETRDWKSTITHTNDGVLIHYPLDWLE